MPSQFIDAPQEINVLHLVNNPDGHFPFQHKAMATTRLEQTLAREDGIAVQASGLVALLVQLEP